MQKQRENENERVFLVRCPCCMQQYEITKAQQNELDQRVHDWLEEIKQRTFVAK